MILRWLLAAVHLLFMAVALVSILNRRAALCGPLDEAGIRRALAADNLWGITALVLIATGAARAFAGLEKGTAFYLASPAFWLKMGLLVLILALELRPMVTLIRWRIARARGQPLDTSRAPSFARSSALQAFLLVLMVLAATAMARGVGS